MRWIAIKENDDTERILNEIGLIQEKLKEEEEDTIMALLDYQVSPRSISIIMEYGETDLATLIRQRQNKGVCMSTLFCFIGNRYIISCRRAYY